MVPKAQPELISEHRESQEQILNTARDGPPGQYWNLWVTVEWHSPAAPGMWAGWLLRHRVVQFHDGNSSQDQYGVTGVPCREEVKSSSCELALCMELWVSAPSKVKEYSLGYRDQLPAGTGYQVLEAGGDRAHQKVGDKGGSRRSHGEGSEKVVRRPYRAGCYLTGPGFPGAFKREVGVGRRG